MKSLTLLAILLALTALFNGCTKPKDPSALRTAGLLDFDFTMVQGVKPVIGKPLVIEFWATWCGPCHRLFPYLNEMYTDLEGSDIQFVAVTNESFNLVKEFVTERQLKYPIAVDIKDDYGRAINVTYIPFAVIVNPRGEIVWAGHTGKLTRTRIENALKSNS